MVETSASQMTLCVSALETCHIAASALVGLGGTKGLWLSCEGVGSSGDRWIEVPAEACSHPVGASSQRMGHRGLGW